ncbi:hypothetical protein [Kitasatospora purpeofusca]|uniref:hypothetical protein n=1 Tax=Kitasatospora purpeofusca TaxID=67352 RepID=UPI0032519C92
MTGPTSRTRRLATTAAVAVALVLAGGTAASADGDAPGRPGGDTPGKPHSLAFFPCAFVAADPNVRNHVFEAGRLDAAILDWDQAHRMNATQWDRTNADCTGEEHKAEAKKDAKKAAAYEAIKKSIRRVHDEL